MKGLPVLSTSARKGPFSLRSPNMDDDPGPPCSQSTNGADLFPFSAGKYQKNRFEFAVLLTVRNPEWDVRGWGNFMPLTRDLFLKHKQF